MTNPIPHLTRKDFLRTAALIGAGLALPGGRAGAAEPTPKRGGVLAFNLTGVPANFDPMSNLSSTVSGVLGPCYNGLVRFDPLRPEAIIGDLAEAWTISPDGRAYTFTLARGVRFHDGVPMTSADVKTTFDWIRSPPAGVISARKGMMAAVESIETPDALTVVFRLRRPLASFLTNLASGWMMVQPKHILESKGPMRDVIVGTGPFRLKEAIAGVSIELERNKDYFVKGLPYLDGVKAYVIPDQGATWNYLQTGQLHIFTTIQGQDAGQYRSGGNITVLESPSTSVMGVTFNTRVAPFDNPILRKAACLAIDRRTVLDVGQRGQGDFGGLVMPGPWSLPPAELEAIPGYGRDPEANLAEARRLMQELGLAGGLKIRLLVRRIALFEPLGVLLKDQWARIGIVATLDLQDNAAYVDSLNKRNFQAVVSGGSFNSDDPGDLADVVTCQGSGNYAGVCDAESDRRYDAIDATLDAAERKRLANAWERAYLANHAVFCLYWRKRFMGVHSRVHGMVLHPNLDNNIRLDQVWLG